MTLARVVRIPMLLLLLLLLVVDGSRAQAYPREIKPGDVENMLRRASVQTNAEAEDEKHAHSSRTEGCLHDGVRYGSGSAMIGSRRCEYCYCISGTRRCIRPKCLLPLPGCTPLYAPHSCCPVAYNCTHSHPSTMAPVSGNGCRVGERTYAEGEMVRDIEWKAACDNCFCAMGAIRCVPLACAPPLQGCSPIVREGQCCPSTYNCSGSIEVKATQNYASYAFISKDYAKFRKETNYHPAIDQSTSAPVEGRGHRVVEERVSTGAIDIEEDTSVTAVAPYSTAWPTTMETDIMDNEILIGTVDYKSTLEVTTVPSTTTTNELSSNAESTVVFESTTRLADSVTDDSCATCADPAIVTTTTTTGDPSGADSSTISSAEWTTQMLPELIHLVEGAERRGDEENRTASENEDEEEEELAKTSAETKANVIERNKAATHPFAISTENAGDVVVPNDEKSPENSTHTKRTEAIGGKRPVTSPSSTILMPDDILVMNVTVKTNVSVGHIQGVTINPIRSVPPDVEAITHREKAEDYDYVYSKPTLPPSLPNVRIIPFVAEDALVKDKDSVVMFPELRPTDASGFYDIATQENRFSPPVETEGGFVPREPPYFDVPYRSTDLNLEIGTGVTVVSQITSPHRKTDDLSSKCHFENVEYRHGEILPRAGYPLCIICMCYHGKVVCSSEKCPPLKIGCQRINTEKRCCGKIVCVEADESPTVVLDRADATAPSQRQPTVSPDPFRDVIRTEPAPDLPSLIEDMIPYLERGITTPRPTTSMGASKIPSHGSAGNQLLSFDFMEQVPLIRPPFDYDERPIVSPYLLKMKYGANREVLPKDTVSLTHDSENQRPDRKPETPGVFGYERPLTFNRTNDNSKNDPSRTIITERIAKDNASRIDEGSKSTIVSRRNLTGEADNRVTKHEDKKKIAEDVKDDDIYSLDSVIKLLFPTNSSSDVKPIETTRTPVVSIGPSETREENPETLVASSTSTSTLRTELLPTARTETVETSSKVLDNEISTSVSSTLTVAGCNIYGRMYRVDRIITELSSACLECRCTKIGVQCKQLEC
ncbi:uncharacterized protein LOC109856570 [Pseudomyrmex gracilis]|uniref:uncharacterized protein LOC109856570 n=1 Tax=Pseudomyrmex gracilis TaxID=219809 RepID=UPI000994DEF8|nr:uncharacterized protein LOC109856570 [Pseudomyrmex gracilis]